MRALSVNVENDGEKVKVKVRGHYKGTRSWQAAPQRAVDLSKLIRQYVLDAVSGVDWGDVLDGAQDELSRAITKVK